MCHRQNASLAIKLNTTECKKSLYFGYMPVFILSAGVCVCSFKQKHFERTDQEDFLIQIIKSNPRNFKIIPESVTEFVSTNRFFVVLIVT